MRHRPTFEQFTALAEQFTLVPVYRRLVSDTLTPVSAFTKIREGDSSFLFESVVGGEKVGRYSFMGSGPFLRFEAYGNRVRIQDGTSPWQEYTAADPLKELELLTDRYRAAHLAELPRFCGGAVGYAGYDTVRYIEKLPNAPSDDRKIPDLCFGFYDRMVIFDHVSKVILVVTHAQIPNGSDKAAIESAYNTACERADELVSRLQRGYADLPLNDIDPSAGVVRELGREESLPARYQSNFTQAEFEAAVGKTKEYILAGDVFQLVLSQRFRTDTRARPFDIYRALRIVNPSPFMFYLHTGVATLVGASPEIMCRVENGEMVVRPLAGTRRRGATAEEDARLALDLVQDPKERAEHVMLVDLGRNDVGKVCQLGSIHLQELLTVERYSHVMHLSSTVIGQLASDKTAYDAMRSALPAGTLSGAPKVRAMQIIDELEPHRRGPYGGAVGYIDFAGNMDTCIALRTMVIVGQTADVQAGAGIVADSEPSKEYQETVNKAMGLLRALEVAETQL